MEYIDYLKNTKEKQSSYSAEHRHGTAECARQPAAQLVTVQKLPPATKYNQAAHRSPTLVATAKKKKKTDTN